MFKALFNVQLKKKRLRAGLTQKRAAEICGMAPARWCHLEIGFRRPSEQELGQIKKHFRLGEYFVPPCKIHQQLRSDGEKLVPERKPYFQPTDRDSHIRYRSALKRYGPRVQALESMLRRRDDFESLQYACHNLPFDSGLEVLYVLCMLAQGARPVWTAPLWLGHLPHPIMDPVTFSEVGHRPHLALVWEERFYFLQVMFRCPETVKVDVLVREPEQWVVLEINGPGHDHTYDLQRAAAVGLKTGCVTEMEIVNWARGLLDGVRKSA